MIAAILLLRKQQARKIIVAAPVGSRDASDLLRGYADETVIPVLPEPFSSVGEWYDDFSQTGDEEVRRILGSPTGILPGNDNVAGSGTETST